MASADRATGCASPLARPSSGPRSPHDRLTDVLLHGGGASEIAVVLGEVLGGRVSVYDRGSCGRRRAPTPSRPAWRGRSRRPGASGRSVEIEPGTYVAVAAAGEEHLGTLVVHGVDPWSRPSAAPSSAAPW